MGVFFLCPWQTLASDFSYAWVILLNLIIVNPLDLSELVRVQMFIFVHGQAGKYYNHCYYIYQLFIFNH